MQILSNSRALNALGVACVAGLIAYALFAQYVQGLEACPLCIFQRVAFIAAGLVFFVAAFHGARGVASRAYAVLGVIAAAIGAGIAAWHVRIQNLPPDQVPTCGPGLDYLFDAFSVFEAVELVFTGSGECAEINWSFLGLSMPGWALVWFVLLGGLAAYANWYRAPR